MVTHILLMLFSKRSVKYQIHKCSREYKVKNFALPVTHIFFINRTILFALNKAI